MKNLINHDEKSEFIRINKFISEKGICSRREADRFIIKGRVTINGNTAEVGSKVTEGDDVRLDGKSLIIREPLVYLAFNKPVEIICTTDKSIKSNIIDFIDYPKRIFPVGRLDKESEGLIFLTNDGDIVNKILRAGNNHEKEYLVTVDRTLTDEFIKNMSSGVNILDTVTKHCIVNKESINIFKIILTQGLNRQIRRMCEVFNYKVLKLQRIRIMNVTLKDIPSGKWRYLTIDELETINKLVSVSIKTKEASVYRGHS